MHHELETLMKINRRWSESLCRLYKETPQEKLPKKRKHQNRAKKKGNKRAKITNGQTVLEVSFKFPSRKMIYHYLCSEMWFRAFSGPVSVMEFKTASVCIQRY